MINLVQKSQFSVYDIHSLHTDVIVLARSFINGKVNEKLVEYSDCLIIQQVFHLPYSVCAILFLGLCHMICCHCIGQLYTIRARGYKTFFMLNSNEHEIFPAHIC